jgi:hypothetical protein
LARSKTRALLPFPSALAASLVLAGPLNGCNGAGDTPTTTTEIGAGPCALLECGSRVELVLRPALAAAATRARACVDDDCLDLDLGPEACSASSACAASPDGSFIIYLPLSGDALEGSTKHLAALSVARAEGAYSDAHEFRLVKIEPGGAGCGYCYQAKLFFDLPAADDQ